MEKLNAHIEFLEMTEDDPQLLVWLLELRRHRENNWQQCAETAEAKLAELENQEPVAMRYRWAPPHMKMPDGSQFYGDWKLVADAETANPGADYERVNLYARPAPAINLAELVPEQSLNGQAQFLGDKEPYYNRGWNDCRAAILRNIEEAK